MATAGVSTGWWLEVPGQFSQSLRLGSTGASSSSSIGGGVECNQSWAPG